MRNRSDPEEEKNSQGSVRQGASYKSDILQKAKTAVMNRFRFTEPEAHRYIQKCAMDSATDITEVCEMLILLYGAG